MKLLRELLQLDEDKKKKEKGVKTAAKRVYHRDYLKTRKQPYRQYDPSDDHKED